MKDTNGSSTVSHEACSKADEVTRGTHGEALGSEGTRTGTAPILRQQHHTPQKVGLLKISCLVLLLCAGVGMIYFAWQMVQAPLPSPKGGLGNPGIGISRAEAQRTSAAVFYRDQIDPLVDVYHKKNLEAAKRAVETLNTHFATFYRGIEPFTDDITGWGTRFGVLKRMPQDWWNKWWNGNEQTDRVKQYVTDKFEHYVFSEPKLRHALEETIQQFQHDLGANRNALMAQVRLVVQTGDVPVHIRINEGDFGQFAARINEQVSVLLGNVGERSIGRMIVSNVGGEIASWAVIHLGRMAASHFITKLGGATAASVAVGGASSTFLSPGVGNVVGIGVGLVVGTAIDWWMTAEFRARTGEQCKQYLQTLEDFILHGAATQGQSTAEPSWPGLQTVFQESTSIAQDTMRSVLFKTLVERVS